MRITRHTFLILSLAIGANALFAKSFKNTPLPTVLHDIETRSGGEIIINFSPTELAPYRTTVRTDKYTPIQAIRAAIEHLPVKLSINGKYVTLQYSPVFVSGVVQDSYLQPIENVAISAYADTDGRFIGSAMTDADGKYHFGVAYRGGVKIEASCLGFESDTVTAVTDKPAYVQLRAMPTVLSGVGVGDKALVLKEMEVNAEAQRNIRLPQTGRAVIEASKALSVPMIFGEPDIVKALQQQSGVSQGVEAFTGLYVHGGNNDQNLFMYEGLPLYHVGHLAGLFSAFNMSTISKADFYKSYFPSRFGGRLSSVTDITSSRPDFKEWHGRASLGLISGNAYVSGPIKRDRTAISAGIRRTWADVVTVPAIAILNLTKKKDGKKAIAHYAFTDINIRLDHKFSDKLTGRIMGYYGHDGFKLGEKRFDADNKQSDYFRKSTDDFSWGNIGAITTLEYSTPKGPITFDAYFSKYSSRYIQDDECQSAEHASSESYSRTQNFTRNTICDFGTRLSYNANFGIYRLYTGAEYVHHDFNPEEYESTIISANEVSEIINKSPKVKADEAGAYIDNELNICRNLLLNAGARYSVFAMHGVTHHAIEPRAALSLIISDKMSIKSGYSRMSQYVQQIPRNNIPMPTDFYQPIPKGFKPLKSDHYSLGVYATLPSGWYGNVEGWYKTMDNLIEYRDGVKIFNEMSSWDDKLTSGRGWAYGFDLNLTKTSGRVTGSIGYGLMWNWRKFAELNNGKKFPAQYDNRHKINISAEYALNEKIKFNATWQYLTGNRITLSLYEYRGVAHQFPQSPYGDGVGVIVIPEQVVHYYAGRNNLRLPAYHRLDLGMTLTNKYKNGRRGIWTFSLYNAYNHMNALTIKRDSKMSYSMEPGYPTQTFRQVFSTYSLLPVLPSVSYTYVF